MSTQATYLPIANLLSQERLNQINTLCQQGTYTDGKLSATGPAKEVKNNLQMDVQSQPYMAIQEILMTALNESVLFLEATFIKTVYPFVLSKYHAGMEYGWHVDRPLMGNMMRTDIAITVFLNNPNDYHGGELELKTPVGTQVYKLPAGHAVCYPPTQLHRVRPVTKGERRAAVSWIQSMVKSSEQRQLLFDVQQTINTLLTDNVVAPANRLQQIHSNLLRMWAE